MSELNIFTFHKLVEDSPTQWVDVKTSFLKEFINSSKYLNKKIGTISSWKESFDCDLAITFDDGNLSDYDLVFPILDSFKLKATIFIVPSFVGKKNYMNWSHIQELNKYSFEIGSHSMTHKYMSNLSASQINDELNSSKKIIEDKIGTKVNSFAYPYGDFSRLTNDLSRSAGYTNVCSSMPGINKPGQLILKRNSIHSKTQLKNIPLLISNDPIFSSKNILNYLMRTSLKKVIGIEKYLFIKDKFF